MKKKEKILLAKERVERKSVELKDDEGIERRQEKYKPGVKRSEVDYSLAGVAFPSKAIRAESKPMGCVFTNEWVYNLEKTRVAL